jgi:hypothetical protein
MHEERRVSPRYAFDATAETAMEGAEARVPARVTEIGLNGCYMQMGNPPELGSQVFVKIFAEGSFFEANARVVYSRPNSGMGVQFRELKPYFVGVLKKWLLEAMIAKQRPRD